MNAVAELYTGLEAEPLLSALKRLERLAGRSPRQAHSAPRILDLDLLLFDQQIVCTPSLTLPHPGLALRRFVLEPLAELAPDLQDPRSGRRVHELLSTLDDPLRVEKHQG